MPSNGSVALLKEVSRGFSADGREVRGVARAVESGKKTAIELSLVYLAPNGRSDLEFLFFGERALERLPLKDASGGKFAVSDFSAAGGVAIACPAERKIVAFGKFPLCPLSVSDAESKAFPPLGSKNSGVKTDAASKDEEKDGENKVRIGVYDDEAVATENYYEFDKDGEKEEIAEENGFGQKSVFAGDEDDRAFGGDIGGEEEKDADFESGDFQEGDHPFARGYYAAVAGKLDDIFGKFPEEKTLSRMVAESRWVEVDYESGKKYVVGVINESGKPRYVCYGVRGEYGKKPPEFKDYCSFVPSSPFALKGGGFWIMYQDAESGIRIK